MSKSTYLYRLPAPARFLWMLGRADSSDLFGYPAENHWAGVHTTLRLDEEFAHARAVVMRLIEGTPRVRIGFGYSIPDSQVDAKYHDTHESTRLITRRLWDGAVVDDRLTRYVMGHVRHAPTEDRDDDDTIAEFLAANHGQLIIPVWM